MHLKDSILRPANLALVMSVSIITLCALIPSVSAQSVVIDGGEVQTVPGTHASPWTVDDLTIGDTGDGALVVSDGTVVINDGLIIGSQAGSRGTLTVEGAGASLGATGGFGLGIYALGSGGNGTLNILNGGLAHFARFDMAQGGTSNATLNVDGIGSRFIVDEDTTVGRGSAIANINITGDGYAEFGRTLILGYDDGSSATANIDGAGSQLNIMDAGAPLYLGAGANGSTGTLNVSNGGAVIAAGGTGTINLGPFGVTSKGVINIGAALGNSAVAPGVIEASALNLNGLSSVNFNHIDNDYLFSPALVGSGTINQIAGTTILAGDNSGFNGTIGISGGTLSISSASNLGSGATPVFFDGGTLRITDPISSNGHYNLAGSGTIETLANLQYMGTIDGPGALTKTGASVLSLFNTNTYLGGTIIKDGQVETDRDSALGATGTSITLDGGKLLTVGGYTGTDRPIILGANGGTIEVASGQFSFDSAVSGVGSLTLSDGSLVLNNGNNDFTGATTVNGGVLRAGAEDAFSPASGMAINAGSLDLGGFNQTVASLSGAGNVTNSGPADATLTTNSDNSSTEFSGIISDGAAKLALTKVGTGTLTLSGANTYTGGTIITGGTVEMSHENGAHEQDSIGTGKITLAGGGVRAMIDQTTTVNDYEIAAGTTGTVSALAGTTFFINGVGHPGGGATTFNNDGHLVFGSPTDTGTIVFEPIIVTGNGAVEIAAGTTVKDGNATLGALTSLASTTTVDAGGTLDFDGNNGTVANLQGAGTVTNVAATTTIDSGNFSGSITSGSVNKESNGTLILTGINTYTGPTTVIGGTLIVGDDALQNASIASAVTVQTGATLGGHGSVGSTTVNSGGTLAPGASIGTLTVNGDLTLEGGSHIAYEAGAPGADFSTAGQADSITVNGDVSLQGAVLDVANAGGFGPGLYRVIDYTGALTDDGLRLGTTPSGSQLSIQNRIADKHINLINNTGFALNFWNADGLADANQSGGGDGNWSNASPIWTDENGTVTSAMSPQPGFAIFGGDAGHVNVDGSAGHVEATGLQFASDGYHLSGDILTLVADGDHPAPVEMRVGDGSSASENYIATIDNEIASADGLNKTGAGTLVLTGLNGYSGGTTISDGTLSVSADGNLGAPGGALNFAGGILQVTGTTFHFTDRTIGWTTNGGGFDIGDAGNSFGVAADLAGGSLTKLGAGTLVLTGTDNFDSMQVAAGTLIGNTASLSGHIGNAGTVIFDQVLDASFASDIAGLSGTNGGMTKRGTGELTLAGSSSLDWDIEAGHLVSAAGRFTGNAEIGTGAGLTFNQVGDGSYAGALSGDGTFDKEGNSALSLTGDSSAFVGSTTVYAGTLSVNGLLGGSLDVLGGGTLGGNGTIGDTTIASGGTIAPGNSPGTLHVTGDLLLSPGSVYDAEILANGVSDQIVVTGTATVSGSQVAVATLDPETSYKNGQTYTILTADGGVNGAFAGVVSNSAFLNFTLDEKPKAVDLTIGLKDNPGDPGSPPSFQSVADTRNQTATAGALDTLAQSGASLALYNDLLVLDASSARTAFDTLSGEIHASIKTGLIDDSRFIRDAANERLRAAFDGVATHNAAPVLAYGPDGAKEIAPADTSRFAAWGSAFGSWSTYDGNGNAADMDTFTGGFVTGLDGLIAETWRLGLLAGYSHSTFDVDDRRSSGESDNYHLGVYAGTTWNKLSFRSGLAYSWHSIDTSRNIAFPGFDDRLSGDYDAGTFQAFGELGYRIDTATASFEPFANLAHVRLHTDGLDEDGGAAALHADSQTTDTTFATIGLRAASTFTLGGMETTARGMLGWKHAFGDVTPVSTQSFTGSDAFTIAGVPLAEDSAVIEAGLDLSLSKSATLGIAYQGQFGNGNSQNGVNATLGVKF